jgi:hypothetical protein
MGCGCKNTNNGSNEPKQEIRSWSESNKTANIIKYGFKLIGFFIALLTLPFIVLAIIWFMFDLIVLNRQVDMAKITRVLAAKIKFANDDSHFNDEDDDDYDEEDDDYEFDENDYITVDVEDITPDKK